MPIGKTGGQALIAVRSSPKEAFFAVCGPVDGRRLFLEALLETREEDAVLFDEEAHF